LRLPKLREPAKFKLMSDQEKSPPSAANSESGVAYGLWLLILLVVFYALSPGPVAKVFGSPPPTMAQWYAPLGYLCEHVSAARSFYERYAKLWGVKL
jgi:hypothetical protein